MVEISLYPVRLKLDDKYSFEALRQGRPAAELRPVRTLPLNFCLDFKSTQK